MVRFNHNKKYNTDISDYNVWSSNKPDRFYQYVFEANPIVLDQGRHVLAVLDKAYEVENTREKQGEDEITFKMLHDDPKLEYVQNENYIRIAEDDYLIRKIKPSDKAGKSIEVSVSCERDWYDLKKAKKLEKTSWETVTPDVVMTDLLDGVDWKVGRVELDNKRTIELDKNLSNRLKGLREVEDKYDGILDFESVTREVHLLQDNPEPIGVGVIKGKNVSDIEVEYDTKDLVTRLYAFGKDRMTIEDATDGKQYVENYQYTNKVLVESFKDERFTNPYSLKSRTEEILKKLSKPRLSFEVKMQDLSNMTGLSHEKLIFGGIIRVWHEELQIEDDVEIVQWDYKINNPEESKLQLSSKKESLSSLLSDVSAANDDLESEDTVKQNDIINLMVFNYLLNSRAENGFTYWTNNGWEIDPNNGSSINASFLCKGQRGVKKTLEQTVHPSHRDNFTLSLQAATENLKLGNNGQVGVEVQINYENGDSETKFLNLVDEGGGA